MHRTRVLALAAILLVLLVSCSKAEFTVTEIQAQPYVRTDGLMGLSLYVLPDFSNLGKKASKDIQLSVRSPQGSLSWSINASRVNYDGLTYYGSSDIRMPEDLELPKGKWSVDVAFSDGSTVTLDFNVMYREPASALQRYAENKSAEPWFDEISNLTVVP